MCFVRKVAAFLIVFGFAWASTFVLMFIGSMLATVPWWIVVVFWLGLSIACAIAAEEDTPLDGSRGVHQKSYQG